MITKLHYYDKNDSVFYSGGTNVPQVFFNSTLVGGADDLTRLDEEGKLDGMINDCLLSPNLPDFPPPFRKPKSEEYIQVSIYPIEHFMSDGNVDHMPVM